MHLITGPHQSGKSHRLWELLRAEPPGTAVLVTPNGGRGRDLVRQVHAWSGPGLLPQIVSLEELVERLAAGVGDVRRLLGPGASGHLLRGWCADRLAGGPWAKLKDFRATGRELAELCQRLDDHLLSDGDLELAATAARAHDDRPLAAAIAILLKARRALAESAAARGLVGGGDRLAELAAAGAACPWSAIYGDDFINLSPAELGVFKAIAAQRRLVMTAVDDPRLGSATLAERLRTWFPDAPEERLPGIHNRSPHRPPSRAAVAGLLDDARASLSAVGKTAIAAYHYREEHHAGRAIAAWLRRNQVAPADACIYLRTTDASGLALADALVAAGVPVQGRFQVPFLGTALGGLLQALAAWCATPRWECFLAVCERLHLAGIGDDAMPPLGLADLRRPWAALPVAKALAACSELADSGSSGDWGWREPGEARPWLRATVAWLTAWQQRLTVAGAWLEQLQALVERLALGGACAGLVRQLGDLATLAAVGQAELDELMISTQVEVVRDAGSASALRIADAVRDRTVVHPVVFIHGLEHGAWPRRPGAGALLSSDDRRRLAGELGRDPFDEAGRLAGELAAFLAVAARAGSRLVLGIPCGEREPCAWLTTIAAQCGWDLHHERKQVAEEAVPGAPLGRHDSQGAHEHALWRGPVGRPQFAFAIPPRAVAALGLRPSMLNQVFADSFALVCDALALGPALYDRELQEEGSSVHDLLARLVAHPPARWPQVLDGLLAEWIDHADGELPRIHRRDQAARIAEAIAGESLALPAGTMSVAEEGVEFTLPIPGHGELLVRGRLDRLDRLPDGGVRIVDYKNAAIGRYRAVVKDEREGQLLAYLSALQAGGGKVEAAYYLGLRDGGRAGYGGFAGDGRPVKLGDLALIPDRLASLAAAIARFAAGTAVADPDGRSARDYAAIARLDEARLDVLDAGAADGDA